MAESKQMENLCYRAISGQILPDEQAKLDNWLNEEPSHRQYLTALQKAWNLTAERPKTDFRPEVDGAWHQFERQYLSDSLKTSSKTGLVRFIEVLFFPKVRPVIAVALGVLLVAVLVLRLPNWVNPKQTLEARRGETHTFELADGSVVQLNAESALTIPKQFSGAERVVRLSGEAFFKVKSMDAPFTVKTKHGRTTVLGTQFNVVDRGEQTRVVVKEGLVQLESDGYVLIRQGEMSWVKTGKKPAPPTRTDVSQELAWLDGRFVFDRTPFPEVIETLNRRFDVNIFLEDASLENRKLTAEFEKQSLDSILQYVCLAFQTRFEKRENGYQVGSEK